MKSETIQALYDDYKEYQEWYYQNHGWVMEETFREYVQRCIDNDELELLRQIENGRDWNGYDYWKLWNWQI